MQKNYQNIVIKSSRHLKRVFFCLNKKKKIKNTGDFVVEEVSSFIQKIKSKLKNINLSLFNEFLESFQVDHAKYLIKLRNTTANEEFVTEAKNRLSDLQDRIKKKMSKKKKK